MFAVSELLTRVQLLRDADWLPMAVALIAIAAMSAALLLLRARNKTTSNQLPCPESTLPVLGNTLDTMKKQRPRLYDWFTEESLRHGGKPWQLRVVGRPRAVIATSPLIFEDVLKTQLDVFHKGEMSCFIMRDFFGRGILAVEGDEWHFQRKTASHLFSLQMMKDVMNTVIHDKVKLMHDVLLASASGDQLSFRRVITHFTSDVFARIGFGVELDCLKRSLDGDDSENEFIAAFSDCARVVQMRLQQPFWLWRLKRFLDIGDEKKYKQSMQVIDQLMYKIIGESIANKSSLEEMHPDSHKTSGPAKAKDLISFFLASKVDTATAQRWREDEELVQIRDMVVNFIFAGKDTTSNSMSWFIVMMNRYPHVAQKIRDELRAKLPSLMTGELVVPSMEDLKHLTYLEAAIRENLRLNPPVAVTARTAMAATTLSDGTAIESGDRVVVASYASARQPTVWGEDAAEFKPERWIDAATGQLITVSPFKFSPFLAGPRICIGRSFAMLEMKIALAVLMARFECTTVEDPWSITYEIAITCPVDGPLMVKVQSLAH